MTNNVSFHRFLLSSTSGSPAAEEEMGAARKLDMTIKSLPSSMFIVIVVCRGIKVNLQKVWNHSNRGVGVVQFDPPPELVDCTPWIVPHLMSSNILIRPNLRLVSLTEQQTLTSCLWDVSYGKFDCQQVACSRLQEENWAWTTWTGENDQIGTTCQ